jgi:hypothetical protein
MRLCSYSLHFYTLALPSHASPYIFAQIICTSHSSETRMMGQTRRPEISVNFKHLTPRNNPEAPESNIHRGESLKNLFYLCSHAKRGAVQSQDLRYFAFCNGHTRCIVLRTQLGTESSSWSASRLGPFCLSLLHKNLFLLNMAAFGPGYLYRIWVLMFSRPSKLDRAVTFLEVPGSNIGRDTGRRR